MTGDATIVTGRRVAERYRLIQPRSDGAWDAVDEVLRRNVVVHVLRSDASAEAKEHFTAEARTLARLNHRNVVATYDTGVDGDGTSYRVDELPGGKPLDLERADPTRRPSYALQTVRAVSDAHGLGLVHGELTSACVLVDDDGRVQVRGLRLPRTGEELDNAKRVDREAAAQLVLGLAQPGNSALRDAASRWRVDPPPTIDAMLDALADIPDDTHVDAVIPGPAPAAGVPAVQRRGRQGMIVAVAALVAAAVAAALVLPNQRDEVEGDARALAVTAKSFDPEASPPTENEREAKFAVDGNAATAWRTERYRRANFGNLKSGVGLILQSQDGNVEFDHLVINGSTRGWQLEVYVAEQPASEKSGWGEAVASTTVQGETTTIALEGADGAAVLLWITDPGPSRQVRINEVVVQGRT